MTKKETEYLEKVLQAVLKAVVLAGAAEGETEGGYIDLPLAHEALIMAMGALALHSGNFPNPSDMERLSERMAQTFLRTMRNLSAAQSTGKDFGWAISPINSKH